MSNEQTATESNENSNQQGEVESTIANDTGEQNQVEQQDQIERPEWLPEKFETPEQLKTSYENLERRFHARRDEIKEEVINELNENASQEVPISPADYKVELSDEDGNALEVPEDDQMLSWFRDKAHNMALSNEEFNDFVSEYMSVSQTSGPDWNEESQELGEHADRRLERIDAWANSVFDENNYNVFAGIPASANMVKFFENVMELNGQPKFNMTSNTEFQESVTREDLMAAQRDEKYWKNGGDPNHIAKVRAMADQLSRKRA
jgi:hypothetical protein